jgi:DNA N-6-adenine-methyltransferase Dam
MGIYRVGGPEIRGMSKLEKLLTELRDLLLEHKREADAHCSFDGNLRPCPHHDALPESEDDTDAKLWKQAKKVVEQLDAGMSQRELASQWRNARTGEPYSQHHVSYVRQVVEKFTSQKPRPRFRDAYNEIANTRKPAEPKPETVEQPDEQPTDKHSVHFSSESPEHYTPDVIIEATLALFEGTIDLDPCSNSATEPHVPAKQHYVQKDDGLSLSWGGRVYMNPPYGREIDAWVKKLCDEYETGGVTEAIALVPARTDTAWFRRLRNYVCCFITGRLTFIGNDDPAPFPSAVFYLGDDVGMFYHHFVRERELGDVWQRIEPGMFGE